MHKKLLYLRGYTPATAPKVIDSELLIKIANGQLMSKQEELKTFKEIEYNRQSKEKEKAERKEAKKRAKQTELKKQQQESSKNRRRNTLTKKKAVDAEKESMLAGLRE